MNADACSHKTSRNLHWKVFESIKESKWGTSCKSIYMNQATFILEPLHELLFPVESTTSQKLK